VWGKRPFPIFKLDKADKEMIAALVLEFREACTANNLNFTNGPTRYSQFRLCLTEPFRSEFEDVRVSGAHAMTVDGFNACVVDFVNRYFQNTDMLDQRRYLQQVKKPFGVSVVELASRLRRINQLMSVLNAFAVVYTDQDLKLLFFPMMLNQWKQRFLESARDVTADATTFQEVINYMIIQETVTNARDANKREGSNEGGRNKKRRTNNNNTDSNESQDNRNPGRGSGGRGGRGNRRGGRGGRGGGGRGNGNGGQQRSGACPFPGHSNHTWAECFGNPQGRNYKPGWELNPDGPSRSRNNNRSGRNINSGTRSNNNNAQQADAHHVHFDDTANNNNNNNNNNRNNNSARRNPEEAHFFDAMEMDD
jgi:hypothetical protein